MRTPLTVIFMLLSLLLSAQRCDWMAFTDCGAQMSTTQVCADDRGNVFTGGQYQGEALFHSTAPVDSAIDKYTSTNWRKTFIARYDRRGKLCMVVQFRGDGSNSNSTYLEGMRALPNGNCLAFVMATGRVDFIDPKGNHIETGNNGRGSNLFCIDTLGRLVWSVRAPIEHCRFMETVSGRTIFLFGNSQNTWSNDNLLLKYSAAGVPLDTMYTGGPDLMGMCLKGDRLYAIASNSGFSSRAYSKSRLFEMPGGSMGLYSIDTANLVPSQLFTCPVPMVQDYPKDRQVMFRASVNYTSDVLYADILVTDGGTVKFLGKTYPQSNGNALIIRLDGKGEIVASTTFREHDYGCRITPAPGGAVYILLTAWGNAFHMGSDSLVLPARGEYVYELVMMKLDAHFNRVWWCTAGGTDGIYESYIMATGKHDELLVFAELSAPCNVFGRQATIQWSRTSYVAKLEE
ncbi:MAG TPA: hypothetical protein VFU15_11210 [Bacteroidia bacterium]|nr:hypothetical protein [Bacteroidia bacterium]